MTVAYRSSTSTVSASTNLVLSVPSGVQDGDLLIAFLVVNGSGNLPGLPSGWNSIDAISATGPSARSYYRVASSEPASYSFSITSNDSAGVMVSYTGANTASPIDKHSAFNRLTGGTTATATGVTTDKDGCMLVFVTGVAVGESSFTGPTSYNQRGTPTDTSAAALVADILQNTQGATGNISATFPSTGNCQSSLIAISPAIIISGTMIAPNILGLGGVGG